MKFRTAQPAAFEPIPEQDRVHLPSEFVNPPDPVFLDHLARRIERQAVEPAQRLDLAPVLADILITKRDVIRPIGAPPLPLTTRIEALARHKKFGNTGDGLTDPPRFVRRKLRHAKAVALGIIATINPRERDAVGISHLITLGIFPDKAPGRLETTA